MAEELSPYRGQELQSIEYRSKWDDLGDHVRYVKQGAITLCKRGGVELYRNGRDILKWLITWLTSLVWGPLLMFWVVGFKHAGGSFYKDAELRKRVRDAKDRLKRSEKDKYVYERTSSYSTSYNKNADTKLVEKYDKAPLIPIVCYENSLIPVAVATGIIDFSVLVGVIAFLLLL